MAISDIIVRGFGNGTFDPGVNKLPTRGYTPSAAITVPSVPGAESVMWGDRSHSRLSDERSHSRVEEE